jgi:hypothetical protein
MPQIYLGSSINHAMAVMVHEISEGNILKTAHKINSSNFGAREPKEIFLLGNYFCTKWRF